MSNTTFAEKREKLLTLYVNSFDEKIDSLLAELDKFANVPDETTLYDFTDLQLIVHKLAGSAGSYGFMDIGTVASGLDKILLNKTKNILDMNVVKTLTMELVQELRKHQNPV